MAYCEDLDTIEQVMQAFEAFVVSIGYQRDEADMLTSLKRVRFRVASHLVPPEIKYNIEGARYYEDDDAQVLYGFLVLTLGDYGIAPRSGWISDSYLGTVLSQLDTLISQKENQLETLQAMEKEGVE